MSLSEEIQAWFQKDGSFMQGVHLYDRTGHSLHSIRFHKVFRLNYVPEGIEQQLRYQLQLYIENNPHTPHPNPTINNKQSTISQKSEERAEKRDTQPEEPEVIKNLRTNARHLHKRHSYLHPQLSLLKSKAERYQVAQEIMEDVLPQLDHIYDTIRHWQATGELPAPGKTNNVVKETVEKFQRVLSLRPRISKLNKWLNGGKTLSDEKVQEYQKELVGKKLELKQLEEELGL